MRNKVKSAETRNVITERNSFDSRYGGGNQENYQMPQNKKSVSAGWVVVTVIIALIAGGIGGYYYLKNQEIKQNITEITSTEMLPTNEGKLITETYTSDKLGISFQYPSAEFQIQEKDNKIYLFEKDTNPEEGQWVEVFTKDPSESLEKTIKDKFLKDDSAKSCRVLVSSDQSLSDDEKLNFQKDYDDNFVQVAIVYPEGYNFETDGDYCPETYTQSSGRGFFLMKKQHLDKFLFFKIGQYLIDIDENTAWQNTIKIIN